MIAASIWVLYLVAALLHSKHRWGTHSEQAPVREHFSFSQYSMVQLGVPACSWSNVVFGGDPMLKKFCFFACGPLLKSISALKGLF